MRTTRAIALAFPLVYICLLVALLIGKPKAAGIVVVPLIGLVADGSVMLDASGNVVLNDDGTVRLASGTSDSCNCDCCPACGSCSDSVPDAYIATFTGITACWTGCRDHFTHNDCSLGVTAGSMPNGTYTVPCDTACHWRLDNIFSTTYTDVCSGSFVETDSARIVITKTAGGINVNFSDAAASSWFFGTVVAATCSDAGGYTVGDTTSCNPIGCSPIGNGGSCSLTPT